MSVLPIEIEQRREDITTEIENFGAQLLEINFRKAGYKSILTFVVDKVGGITLQDCVEINHRLSEFFDRLTEGDNGAQAADFLRGSYMLEVNSPGLDRPLTNAADFLRAVGQTVRVIVRESSGKTLERTGVVMGIDAGEVRLAVAGQRAQEMVGVPLSSIVRAVREIRFK